MWSRAFARAVDRAVTNQEWAKWLRVERSRPGGRLLHLRLELQLEDGNPVQDAGGIAVRGTYSTAFRAPNVAELYSGNFDDFPFVN